MIRQAMNELVLWKDRPGRKPLLLRGARQVGKTWLMREFGRLYFDKAAYINFDDNELLINLSRNTRCVHQCPTIAGRVGSLIFRCMPSV